MENNIAEMWLVFVIAGMLWFPGFLSQKAKNRIRDNDYSVEAKGVWICLMGVRQGRARVYLRPASIQVVGLLYLVVGFLTVWFYDVKSVLNFGAIVAGLGLVGCSFVWFIIDIIIPALKDKY
ncbi:MAG: hypothetical protein GY832_04755 [Chloroflexi bacterium]|nr:hypothetical protein [Chloroflexota bacterium]